MSSTASQEKRTAHQEAQQRTLDVIPPLETFEEFLRSVVANVPGIVIAGRTLKIRLNLANRTNHIRLGIPGARLQVAEESQHRLARLQRIVVPRTGLDAFQFRRPAQVIPFRRSTPRVKERAALFGACLVEERGHGILRQLDGVAVAAQPAQAVGQMQQQRQPHFEVRFVAAKRAVAGA